ncbi:hypothetical protein [Streptomyces tubercidicus]|uniref:hypothetical protein n=1 Tax=Streptomyces tubercidicus TaxID=47759 RepID=UPI003467DFC4
MTLLAFNPPAPKGSYLRQGTSDGPVRTGARHRWTGRLLTGAGLALLPWIGYLAGTLPPTEAITWVTLDTLEAVALLLTGTRLLHGNSRHRTPAAATAILLLTDATLDLATATPGTDLATAIAMALAAELPLAALCTALATRPARSPGDA